tara:strand:- start:376 stop:504 length:129 start_codon:yes stop_codon:yes gene_type:complete
MEMKKPREAMERLSGDRIKVDLSMFNLKDLININLTAKESIG